MHILTRAALITFLGFAIQTSAQPRVCIGGDLDSLTQTQKNGCRASADHVRVDAEKFHAPADWHFFVICTESDWTVYAAFSQRSAQLASSNVDTDLQKRTTFLRGATLSMSDPSSMHRLIAHESARALLQTHDEVAIQKQMSVWIPESDAGAMVLASNRKAE